MSVLLTAGKSAVGKQDQDKKARRPRKERHKTAVQITAPKRQRTQNTIECTIISTSRSVTPVNPHVPPHSNERTAVWYWPLDGIQTTLMLNKSTMELWCNGRTLTDVVLSEGRVQPRYVQFRFQTSSDRRATVHRGCIRVQDGGSRAHADQTTFSLYVDGAYIDEHLPGSRHVTTSSGHLAPPPADSKPRAYSADGPTLLGFEHRRLP